MKKLLLLSVLSIFMIACHQPDTPPYSYSMNIDMQIISSLETTYPLDNLETVIINSRLELASSSYRIKTLISSNDYKRVGLNVQSLCWEEKDIDICLYQ